MFYSNIVSLLFNNFFRKLCRLLKMRYSRKGYRWQYNRTHALRIGITNPANKHSECVIAYLLFFYGSSGYVNAPQCCILLTVPLLLYTVLNILYVCVDVFFEFENKNWCSFAVAWQQRKNNLPPRLLRKLNGLQLALH